MGAFLVFSKPGWRSFDKMIDLSLHTYSDITVGSWMDSSFIMSITALEFIVIKSLAVGNFFNYPWAMCWECSLDPEGVVHEDHGDSVTRWCPGGLNVSVKETARRWNRGGDVRCTWYSADCVSGDRIQDRVAAKLIFCQSDAHVSRPLLAVLVHITRLHNFVMQHSGSSRSLYVVSYCASSRVIGMMIMTKYK